MDRWIWQYRSKTVFMTSLVSEYARPNINIKINGKRFSGLLNIGSDITIISTFMAQILAYTKKSLAKLQEFLKPKYKKFIKIFKSTDMKDQNASLQH